MKIEENQNSAPEENSFGLFNFEDLIKDDEKPEGASEEENEEQEEEEELTDLDKTLEEKPKPKDKEEKTVVVGAEPNNVFANLTKKYIEMGTWQNATVEIDGEEVALADIENLNEETFLQIQKSQDTLRDQDLKDKYINKEELDEISLNIVEISKRGGDISNVLKVKQQYIDPLEHFDLDNEQHQEVLVREKYRLQGLAQEDIEAIVERKKQDLTLDTEANQYASRLKASYKKILEDQVEKTKQEEKEKQEKTKTLKKSLRDAISAKGFTNDSTLRALTETGLNGIDEQIKSIKEDPEKLADLVLFLNKREEYLKTQLDQSGKSEKDSVLRKLSIIPKQKEDKAGKQQEKKEEKSDLVFKYIN